MTYVLCEKSNKMIPLEQWNRENQIELEQAVEIAEIKQDAQEKKVAQIGKGKGEAKGKETKKTGVAIGDSDKGKQSGAKAFGKLRDAGLDTEDLSFSEDANLG